MSEKLPYIVSADAEHLMSVWSKQNNLKIPDSKFFLDFQTGCVEHIRDAAISKSDNFEPIVLPHNELASGLQNLVSKHQRGDTVALDRAYVGDTVKRQLEVTRAVNTSLESIGTRPRPHTPPITEQLDHLTANSHTELTLIDDVVFSGDAIIEVADWLRGRGAHVSTVLAAISISEGRQKIEKAGIEVISVVEYKEVKDEICERDFLAGVPLSGRTVYREDGGYYSAPYFAPFGSPERWASIEDAKAARKLSRYCIESSVELWQRVEQLNRIDIPHSAIPRQLEYDASDERFIKYLAASNHRVHENTQLQ